MEKTNKNAKAAGFSEKEKIIAGVLVFVVVALAFAGVIFLIINKGANHADYMEDDLGRYVEISPELYQNVEVDIPLLSYSDAALTREINKLLVKNKTKDALYNGANITSMALTLGDVANIWYRGFTIDENGREVDVELASNFTESSAHQLELGSGSFIAGIEEALLGKIPSQGAKFEKITSGRVGAENVIYATYEKYTADGGFETVKLGRIDLGDPTIDEIYGAGFRRALISQQIGYPIDKEMIFRVGNDNVDTIYYGFTIEFATACENDPISVKVEFPADYSYADLRGKEVIFELYVSSAVLYDTPVWSDDFILNTLKMSEEELSSYSGNTLCERYESKLREEILSDIEEGNKNLKEEAMWSFYTESAEFKRLPSDNVDEIYTQYYNDLTVAYSSYSLYYSSLDEFAIAYYGLSEGANWRAYITQMAESVVKEKLVFYYIVREENLIPEDAEYQRLYNENVEEMFVYYKDLYKTELDACKTDAEREELLSELHAEMMEYYGEEYFREAVLYQYAVDRLLNYVTVKAE